MAVHVVVDGLLPANVDATKREKFQTILKAQIAKEMTKKTGTPYTTDSFQMSFVTDAETKNVSAAFLAFKSIGDAEKAVAALNSWKFTKAVECKAFFWADFNKFGQVEDQFVAPENEETLNLEELKANDFLLDPTARPQFLLKGGQDLHCEWYWFGKNKTADLIKKPGNRSDDHVACWSEVDQIRKKLQPGLPMEMPMWSPQGTYLITTYQQGLRFWGGKGLQLLSDLIVEDLHYVGISPCETYALTYNREYVFWNILEARKVRTLAGPPMSKGAANCAFKYNADDSMVGIAKLESGKESLSFYTASTMALISPEAKNYTAKADGLAAFEWSPRDASIFACALSGDQHTGWCIEVNRIAENGDIKNVSRRNVLQATNVQLLWHPDGSHVAARVTKVKCGEDVQDYLVMTVGYNSVATHIVAVKGGRTVLRFNWANKKPRFSCILAADPATKAPAAVAFFKVEQKGCHQIGMLNMDVDRVYWSTKGKEAVTVNKKKSTLDFIVVEDDSVERVQKDKDHSGVTDVSWDASGRFVCSYVSTVYEEAIGNPGFKIWSVFGDVLDSSDKYHGRFSHLMWRPLPKSLLTDTDHARIEKELPKRRVQYEAEELAQKNKIDAEETKRKNDIVTKYVKTMKDIEAHHVFKNFDAQRADLRAKAPALKRHTEKLAKSGVTVTETEEEVTIISETIIE